MMKKVITGEEFKLNSGGISKKNCPKCNKRLYNHKSSLNGAGENILGRYFCVWDGGKYELGVFKEVSGLEFLGVTNYGMKPIVEKLKKILGKL